MLQPLAWADRLCLCWLITCSVFLSIFFHAFPFPYTTAIQNCPPAPVLIVILGKYNWKMKSFGGARDYTAFPSYLLGWFLLFSSAIQFGIQNCPKKWSILSRSGQLESAGGSGSGIVTFVLRTEKSHISPKGKHLHILMRNESPWKVNRNFSLLFTFQAMEINDCPHSHFAQERWLFLMTGEENQSGAFKERICLIDNLNLNYCDTYQEEKISLNSLPKTFRPGLWRAGWCSLLLPPNWDANGWLHLPGAQCFPFQYYSFLNLSSSSVMAHFTCTILFPSCFMWFWSLGEEVNCAYASWLNFTATSCVQEPGEHCKQGTTIKLW